MIGNKKEIIDWLLEQDSEIQFEIKEHRKKRSLSANGYCWILLQQIADALGTTKEQIYREYIKDKGIFRIVEIDNQAVNTFIHIWEQQGLGWICEVSHTGKSTSEVIAYYGTSSYNTKQMAKYIDFCVESAKDLGIETMTPQEIALLKQN